MALALKTCPDGTMEQQREERAVDLFQGIDGIINRWIGGPGYRSKSAALFLDENSAHGMDGLVESLFQRLDGNWNAALVSSRTRSRQNFRWHEPQLFISPHNRSAEVTLERALVRACMIAGRRDWSNQVPLISGVAGSRSFRRRAIDLVHCSDDGSFELVELKVGSDTPLFAALEILIYGLLWLLSRRDRELLGYRDLPMLETSVLHLTVLAPLRFYRGFHLSPFIAALDAGIATVGRSYKVEMGLRQMAFPEAFEWPAAYRDAELLDMLDGRRLI